MKRLRTTCKTRFIAVQIVARCFARFVVVVLLTLMIPGPADAHTIGVDLSAFGTPTIDGTLSPSEWDSADTIAFPVKIPISDGGGTVPGILYEMNDHTNLYLAVEFPHTAIGNSASIEFDNDHGGGPVVDGDDIILISPGFGVFDEYRVFLPSGVVGGLLDSNDGGTNDVDGAFSNVGGVTVYEFSHSLDSTDCAHDFSLGVGDTVGFGVSVRLLNPDIADTFFPHPSRNLFGDITIIPEPSTLALGTLGLIGLLAYGSRRRRRGGPIRDFCGLSDRTVSVVACVLIVGVFAPGSALGVTITASDVATGKDVGPKDGIFDNFINPGTPSTVDNGFTELALAAEFAVSSLSTSTLVMAELNLVQSNLTGDTRQLNVWGYTADGIVALSDVGDRSNALASMLPVNASTPITLDVTAFVVDELTGGASFIGFVFEEEEIRASLLTKFYFRPRLEVQEIPEPSAVTLAGLGVIGLLAYGCSGSSSRPCRRQVRGACNCRRGRTGDQEASGRGCRSNL